ncbi:MAG: HAMP domain-containing protein [Candidatus Methylopumilus sp.]|nr:HAMP domain-containing protein [Candidatus Methylopumilus sp.]
MKYIVSLSIVLAAVLLYLLSQASSQGPISGNYYTLLLVLNICLALLLLLLIGVQIVRMYRQIKASAIGGRLTRRLLGAFSLVAIIPGLIVYLVSVNFLTQSIESWFNVKVEAALEGGVHLGQSALDALMQDVKQKGESMALNLAFQPSAMHVTVLSDLREKTGVQDAVLLSLQGKILAFSSAESSSFLPNTPSVEQLRQAKLKAYGNIEPISGKGLYLRVLVPVNNNDVAAEPRILQLLQPVPKQLSSTAEEVQAVYQDYQELSLGRQSMKEVFALTLTLVLMLTLLTAMSIAFFLSRRFTAPIGVLAEGTRAIASGDYGKQLPAQGRDELGILVQSFNSMTQQLAEATQAANRNRERVEAARAYLELILAHLSTGVIALNERDEIRTYNLAAANILGLNLHPYVSKSLKFLAQEQAALKSFVQTIAEQYSLHPMGEWHLQLETTTAQGKRTLMIHGSRLPGNQDRGHLLMFDDITTMVQAQRDAAWGEVARRLAHEIKNPLTPIQLSAERLEFKLADKLTESDRSILERATKTIVEQVGAMKTMVNEFSEYARAPVVNLALVDINDLVRDVLELYQPEHIQIVTDLCHQSTQVMGDAVMLRQVLHNLLQNAQDALDGVAKPVIEVRTDIQAQHVTLSVSDNGSGFPIEMMTRAFEPYVTSKPHGTGLGLAIVKKMIEEHKGQISLHNLNQQKKVSGAQVIVSLPLASEMSSPSSSASKSKKTNNKSKKISTVKSKRVTS